MTLTSVVSMKFLSRAMVLRRAYLALRLLERRNRVSMLSIVRNASSGSEFIQDSARSRWRMLSPLVQPPAMAVINDKAVANANSL